jgi:hypothetical protein
MVKSPIYLQVELKTTRTIRIAVAKHVRLNGLGVRRGRRQPTLEERETSCGYGGYNLEDRGRVTAKNKLPPVLWIIIILL